jgi:uncharacterized protein YwgA
MDILEKLAKLAAALNAADGSVLGKKKLQKLVYLAQEKGLHLGYDYDYHFHGVFCSELEADLRIAESYGVVTQEVTMEYGNPVEIALNPDAIDQEVADEILCDEDEFGLKLIHALKDEPARVLEVLSTIVYLTNEGYEGGERNKHLLRLKGHLVDYFQRAKELHKKYF